MAEYKITFDYVCDEIDDYDDDAIIEIKNVELNGFGDTLMDEGAQEYFEDWYNNGSDNPIKLTYFSIDTDNEKCYIDVDTDVDVDNEYAFANELITYLFEDAQPSVYVNISGHDWVPAWDGYRQGPTERKEYYDFDETFTINKFTDVEIKKIA